MTSALPSELMVARALASGMQPAATAAAQRTMLRLCSGPRRTGSPNLARDRLQARDFSLHFVLHVLSFQLMFPVRTTHFVISETEGKDDNRRVTWFEFARYSLGRGRAGENCLQYVCGI
jgi:hypothetical protein